MLIRGDCVHAGAEYHEKPNFRLHVYLDCSTIERKPNRTQFAEKRRHLYPFVVLPMFY
jgi:hypothetical protein